MRIASFACAFLFSEVATGALQDKIEHFASNECVGTPFATSQNLPEYRCTALPLWPISSLDQKLLGNFTSIPSHVVLSTTPIALVAKFYAHGESLCNPNTTTITQLSSNNIDSGCCIPIAEKYAIRVASFHGDWTSCSKHQVGENNFGASCSTHSECNAPNSVCLATPNWQAGQTGYCESCSECTGFQMEGDVDQNNISDPASCPTRCKTKTPCYGDSNACISSKKCETHTDCLNSPNQYCQHQALDKTMYRNTSVGSCQTCTNCTEYEDWWNTERSNSALNSPTIGKKCPSFCNPDGQCFLGSIRECRCPSCIQPRMLLFLAICLLTISAVITACVAIIVNRAVKNQENYTRSKRVYLSLGLGNLNLLLFIVAEKSKDNWGIGPLLPSILGILFAQLFIFSVPILSLESISCCGSQPIETGKVTSSASNLFGSVRTQDEDGNFSTISALSRSHRNLLLLALLSYTIACSLTVVILVQGTINHEIPVRGVLLSTGVAGSVSILCVGFATHLANIKRAYLRIGSPSESDGDKVSSSFSVLNGSFRTHSATVKPIRPVRNALQRSTVENSSNASAATHTGAATGRAGDDVVSGDNRSPSDVDASAPASYSSVSSIPIQLRESRPGTPPRSAPPAPQNWQGGSSWSTREQDNSQHNHVLLPTASASLVHSGSMHRSESASQYTQRAPFDHHVKGTRHQQHNLHGQDRTNVDYQVAVAIE